MKLLMILLEGKKMTGQALHKKYEMFEGLPVKEQDQAYENELRVASQLAQTLLVVLGFSL